jgi:hypothetical protein
MAQPERGFKSVAAKSKITLSPTEKGDSRSPSCTNVSDTDPIKRKLRTEADIELDPSTTKTANSALTRIAPTLSTLTKHSQQGPRPADQKAVSRHMRCWRTRRSAANCTTPPSCTQPLVQQAVEITADDRAYAEYIYPAVQEAARGGEVLPRRSSPLTRSPGPSNWASANNSHTALVPPLAAFPHFTFLHQWNGFSLPRLDQLNDGASPVGSSRSTTSPSVPGWPHAANPFALTDC